MNIQEFAEKYRLRLKKDGCGDWIVLGRSLEKATKRIEDRCHVYDGFEDGKLGVYLYFGSPKKYGNARRALLAVGCEGKQGSGNVRPASDYPTDGCLKFDPENADQAQAVIRLAGLKRRKVLSMETLDRLKNRFVSIQRPQTGSVAA